MKKNRNTKKPSRLDEILRVTTRDHLHESSNQISSRLIVLSCEVGELERKTLELTAALAATREQRVTLNAIIAGLGGILDARR